MDGTVSEKTWAGFLASLDDEGLEYSKLPVAGDPLNMRVAYRDMPRLMAVVLDRAPDGTIVDVLAATGSGLSLELYLRD